MDYSLIDQYIQHGGAYDRGSADKYYGRAFNPHYRVFDGFRMAAEVRRNQMTADEIAAYAQGYQDELGEKDYGREETGILDDLEQLALRLEYHQFLCDRSSPVLDFDTWKNAHIANNNHELHTEAL